MFNLTVYFCYYILERAEIKQAEVSFGIQILKQISSDHPGPQKTSNGL